MKTSPLGEHIKELLEPMPVRVKGMFSGFGVYRGDVMFGLIAEEELYFKVDETNQPDYEREGCEPFCYGGNGHRLVKLPYWRVPEALFDDALEFSAWAEKAYAVAVAHYKPKKSRKKKA